ncbi:hypothetical protein ABT288_47310 [Streptomyces sp. NPDC001093]|uniref:hypothetical protein n=1 Tax=Streptomyces sp. NPDC001093 TaxID=3154376 RepID=UPI003320E497
MRAQDGGAPAAGGVGDAVARPVQDTGALRDECTTAPGRLGAVVPSGAYTAGAVGLATAVRDRIRAAARAAV